MTDQEIFLKNVTLLSQDSPIESESIPCATTSLPSIEMLTEIVGLVRELVFPGYFDQRQEQEAMRAYHTGVKMERLCNILSEQIQFAMRFQQADCADISAEASSMTMTFIDRLPEMKRVLYTDVRAIFDNDPAAHTISEVIFCYPVVQAMIHYRMAHELHLMGVPVLPRIITEMAHSATGIDIHPGATIGHHFAIDHGTGVVIGATCIIGNNVKLYQGVTLGAKSFPLDKNGNPIKGIPRHPILEDDVIVYSNATILGRITIGKGAIVGGNIWVTEDVKPGARITQNRAKEIDNYTNYAI